MTWWRDVYSLCRLPSSPRSIHLTAADISLSTEFAIPMRIPVLLIEAQIALRVHMPQLNGSVGCPQPWEVGGKAQDPVVS
eukprot:CAMPEP_0118925450 /NCGR_PEP_ID=MMETSP1169-20130426/3332_1 /TAXON_ID=36882 /ORGANISM="Pyramimonas obovata, Strain CCMP722" /LENGTH=79 /DNA_ID=CAMNT_0006866749 /DNA_START=21 /DNA_END=260 /DNA_ORIENTATION=+